MKSTTLFAFLGWFTLNFNIYILTVLKNITKKIATLKIKRKTNCVHFFLIFEKNN